MYLISTMACDTKLYYVLVILLLCPVRVEDRIEPSDQQQIDHNPLLGSGQIPGVQVTTGDWRTLPSSAQQDVTEPPAGEHSSQSSTGTVGTGGNPRNEGTSTATANSSRVNDGKSGKGKPLISSPFTIVSALFDLGRDQWPYFRRSFDTYLTYSVQMLQMEVPLVAFVDVRTEKFVRLCRRGKEHITVLHILRLEDLALYTEYLKVVEVMQSEEFKRDNLLLNHPEGFSAEYNILMNSKAAMLLETSRRNYFNSSHFFWMDMGYGHGSDVYPADNQWTPWNLIADMSNRITFIAVNNLTLVKSIFDVYKKRVGPGVNGGFFGGSQRAVEVFHDIHRHVFKDFIRSSMMDDDQTVALECYLRYPYLFNIVQGGWYDVFTLFR